jgi:hypothetical protein
MVRYGTPAVITTGRMCRQARKQRGHCGCVAVFRLAPEPGQMPRLVPGYRLQTSVLAGL